MKNQKGFSLIELLIVVVIIGIIAAIAIPNLLAARRSANEGSAASSLRTIHGAEATYQATAGVGNFSGDTETAVWGPANTGNAGLAPLAAQNLIDGVLAAGGKSGYEFGYIKYDLDPGINPASFAAAAIPQQHTGIVKTGTRGFGIATDGVLWTATTNDTDNSVGFGGGALTGATVVGGGGAGSLTVMGNQ